MSTTPYMSLVLPTPGADEGTWDDLLNAALATVDAHDHTPGKGSSIPSNALNINTNMVFKGNRPVEMEAAQFNTLSGTLSGAPNANAVQFVNGDLWITNGAGVPVQITSGGSVVVAATSNTPPGMIVPFGGTSAPPGYLLANGDAVSRVTFSVLFGAIGTIYGAGDGTTTFNLPNAIGRTIIGAGTYTDPVSGSVTRTIGDSLGSDGQTLTIAQLAAHAHGGGDHTHLIATERVSAAVGNLAPPQSDNGPAFTYPTQGSGTIISTEGNGDAHNNMPPSLVANYIIKT